VELHGKWNSASALFSERVPKFLDNFSHSDRLRVPYLPGFSNAKTPLLALFSSRSGKISSTLLPMFCFKSAKFLSFGFFF